MKMVLWFLSLAIMFHAAKSKDESAQSFRIIPIPTRESGYSNFASIAFMSRAAMDSFLTDTSKLGWNNRQQFEDALRNAKVDFSKEALVLLRHTEGSGTVQVTFGTPVLQDRNLLCEIRGRPIPPGYFASMDMAYYCFAVAVSKAQISQVELQAIEGGFSARRLGPIVLPITEKEPASKPLPPSVNQNQIQDCPIISVSCPDAGLGGNTPIRFKASATGGKPRYEISYNWSVSKGTISWGQGTAVIEVQVTGTDVEGLTATVEVNGFDPDCPRVASCSVAIP